MVHAGRVEPPGGTVRSGGAHPARRRVLTRRARRRWLWWSGGVLLAGFYVIWDRVITNLSGEPFFLFGPVATSASRLSLLVLGVGLACWFRCFWLWSTRAHGRRVRLVCRIAAGIVSTITAVVAVPVLAVCVVLGLLALPNAVQRFHVLSPASPGGCRLVIWQSAVEGMGKDAGRDTWAYLYVPGSHVLRSVGGGVVFLDPSNHTTRWTLTWNGNTAHLTGWSTDGQTWNALQHQPVVCPAA